MRACSEVVVASSNSLDNNVAFCIVFHLCTAAIRIRDIHIHIFCSDTKGSFYKTSTDKKDIYFTEPEEEKKRIGASSYIKREKKCVHC